jgi:hypothetical protein
VDDCNLECHKVERWKVLTEVEIKVRLILDGDDEHIHAILEALEDLPEAA